jgi:hypothetical protein
MRKIHEIPKLTDNEIRRFWKKVAKSNPENCWIWTGYCVPAGYGQIGFRYGLYFTHRISWYIETGIDPSEKFVLHKCDNPPCVNPNHLFLGDALLNSQDMMAKGRADHSKNPFGEAQSKSKLTEIQIVEIWQLHLHKGLGERKLAEIFNVTPANIHAILSGKTWKHLIPENTVPTALPKQGFRRKPLHK